MRSRRRGFVGVVVCGVVLAALLAVVGSSAPAGAAVPFVFDGEWGSSGTGPGEFNLPVGVVSSGFQGGTVYVLDYGNARVQRFTVDGTILGEFGSWGSGNDQFIQPGGIAVGPDGSVYVADTGNQRIVKFDAGGNYQTKWGTYGSGNGQFNFPGGVAVDPVSGDVFVADTLNHRIQKFTASGAFKTKWGTGGSASGRFRSPLGIAVSADRRVYVADTDNNRVQQFTGTGVFQRQWGVLGSGDGEFDSPHGVAVDTSGNVYVADSHNNRVQQFSAAGAFLSKWGSSGTTDGLFVSPLGIGVAPDGVKVLVADTFNHRIQRFAPRVVSGPQPVFVNTWGSHGAGSTQFDSPQGVAVDAAGNVYVADTGNSRIVKYTSTGGYLTQWGSHGAGSTQFDSPQGVAVDAAGNVYVADTWNHRIVKYTSTGGYLTQWGSGGPGDTQFAYPRGVAVDAAGNVYVADTENSRIVKYTSTGGYLTQWGSLGAGSTQFDNPHGVAVDAAGNVYVADTRNSRIVKYTSTGGYLTQWNSLDASYNRFTNPEGVAVDLAGNVYVADTMNHRIVKFTSTGGYLGQLAGDFGSSPGYFTYPEGVAVDLSGNVYVADLGNHRIQKLAPTVFPITYWGTQGTSNTQFSFPSGVAVDPSGNIVYVADQGNDRIVKYTSGSGPATPPVVSLSADQSSVSPGDPIDYHVTVTNTTGSTLTGVRLTDVKAPDCEGSLANIVPGASVVVDCTYNTGADDAGPYVNTATLDSDQTNAVASNAVTTQVGPALTVTMTAPTKVTATGSIPYAIAITNNSALPLTGVRVNDPAVPGCAGPIADIAPGATANVNCTKTTTDADSGSTVFNAVTVDASGAQAGLATAVTRVQGRVTGTITGPGGPVAGAYVLALSRDFLPLQGDTVANGSGVYNLGLDPGRYYLAFLDPSGATQAEYYNNKTSALALTSADLVTVNVGSGPATANATLAGSGFSPPVNPASISGTITDANGPVAGVWVVGVHFGLGGVVGATRTDASGHYTLGGLPAGNNYLEFADPTGTHAFRWYHNSDGPNPTAIPLTAGQAATNINEVLPPFP